MFILNHVKRQIRGRELMVHGRNGRPQVGETSFDYHVNICTSYFRGIICRNSSAHTQHTYHISDPESSSLE